MEGKTPTSTGGAPAQPTGSIHEASAAFSQLLALEEGNQNEDEATSEEETAPEGEATTEEQPAEGETEQESQEEQAESEETETEGEQTPETKFTVRIDGKDEEVTESELIAGYSRQSDYTRKTQALAAKSKALETETAAARQERTEYAQLLPKLRDALEDGMGDEPDWEALRANPETAASATIEWQRRQERKAKIAAVKSEEARLAAQAEQEQAALRNQVIVEEREKMLNAMPAWKDRKVAKRDSEAIENTLKAVGFNDEEMQIFDHRALLVAWKAMKYDEIQAQQPGLKKKIAAAPVVKPGAKKQAANADSAAVKRFNQTGSVKDAGPVFTKFL